jgi:SAM-dependent methyltransferase
MERILSHEINFHPQSFSDDRMRVFYWKGEIYRALRSDSAVFVKKLFQDGVIQKLIDQSLLIESEITPFVLDGYEIVVSHRTIPFISYPYEWCAAMYKDAALTTIDLAIELVQWNLTLDDAHPWNVLFDLEKCRHVFVDWGSIAPIYGPMWSDYDLFSNFFLFPLILQSRGQERISRLLISDEIGVLKSDLLKLTEKSSLSGISLKPPVSVRLQLFLWNKAQRLPSLCRQYLEPTLNSINSLFHKKLHNPKSNLDSFKQLTHLSILEKIRRQVDNIRFSLSQTTSVNHSTNTNLSFAPNADWTEKQRNVYKILTELHPATVLDIGSGTGWYSKLAALLGSKVVAFDIDHTGISKLYDDACRNKLPILPLIMDFTKPTPALGLCDRAAIAATERFQCDLVLALGLVNNIALGRVNPIVGKQFVNFNQIVEGLALFSKQWVVVEFIPFEAQEFNESSLYYYSWYKLDNFINALRKRFSNITIFQSYPEHCVLLLCQK